MSNVVLLDMDGVLCDFVKSALTRHGRMDKYPVEQWDMAAELGITDAEFWNPLVGHEFWCGIDPYEWCFDLVDIVQSASNGNVTLATSPCSDPFSASGKVAWIQKHLKHLARKFLIGPEKHRMAKSGVVLIDDSDSNCAKFSEAGGRSILFPQPWNANRHLCYDRIGYVKSQLEI